MRKLHKNIIFIAFLAIAASAGMDDNVEEITMEEAEAENVEFDDEKHNAWLSGVARNGDVNGRTKAAEFEGISKEDCDDNIHKTVESLNERQTILVATYRIVRENQNNLEQLLKKIKTEFLNDKGSGIAAAKHGKLVLSSKLLFMEIFSAEGEAARLDILDFMRLPAWNVLKFAFELSKIQDAALDQMISKAIWREHLANRESKRLESVGLRRVVIAGAGPNGLMAAFQLFRAGMDVALVNDRLEYTRPQIVAYDYGWMCIMRYVLGTKFDKIFHSPGLIRGERGLINICFVEKALRERLEELAQFIQTEKSALSRSRRGKPKVDLGGRLDLHYGFAVDAKLEAATEKGDKNIYAKLKHLDPSLNKRIPVDLFLCMGGANDKLRQQLLESTPVARSRPVNYTSCIYKKMKINQRRKINVHGALPAILNIKLESMRKQFKETDFDGLITEGARLLPSHERARFRNFVLQLLNDQNENRVVLIENWDFFSIAAKTPKRMAFLFQIIDDKMQADILKKSNKNEALEKFGIRMRSKWCKAAFIFAYAKKAGEDAEPFSVNIDQNGNSLPPDETLKKAFSLDIDSKGTRSFDVIVRTMETPVTEHKLATGADGNLSSSVVVAALGDALANTHFYTGSGMSVGRKGVEYLIKSLKEVISGTIKSKQDFVKNLGRDLKKVADDVVKLTAAFVPNDMLQSSSSTTTSQEHLQHDKMTDESNIEQI